MLLHPDALPLHLARRGDAVHVTFTDPSLGTTNAEDVGRHLVALADEPECREIHLDLGRVEFLTSTFLGKLLAMHKRMKARGGVLTLAHVKPLVYEIFAVTQLTRVLHIQPDESAEVA
jgi:anti-sigma B factor antagonist